jgi:hypothetical protein
MDELDSLLNGSSPQVWATNAAPDELTTLAYSTQQLAVARSGLRWRRIGVPVLIGALTLGGAGAAIASPALRHSLGISPVTTTPGPTPSAAALVLAYPNCRFTFVASYESSAPENAIDVETIAAAQNYLDDFDQAAVLASATFVAKYGVPSAASPLQLQVAAAEERYALSYAALSTIPKNTVSHLLNPTPVAVTGTSSNCGESE